MRDTVNLRKTRVLEFLFVCQTYSCGHLMSRWYRDKTNDTNPKTVFFIKFPRYFRTANFLGKRNTTSYPILWPGQV